MGLFRAFSFRLILSMTLLLCAPLTSFGASFPTFPFVVDFKLNADTTQMAVLTMNSTVGVFDTLTGSVIRQVTLQPEEQPITIAASSLSADLSMAISFHKNYMETKVTVFSTHTGALLQTLDLREGSAARFLTNDLIAVIVNPRPNEDEPFSLLVMEWKTGRTLKRFEWSTLYDSDYHTNFVTSRDGRFVGVSRYSDADARVWDLESGTTRDFKAPADASRSAEIGFSSKATVAVRHFTFNRNTVKIADLNGSASDQVLTFSNNNSPAANLTLSPLGDAVAYFSYSSKNLEVINVEDQKTQSIYRANYCESVLSSFTSTGIISICRNTGLTESVEIDRK